MNNHLLMALLLGGCVCMWGKSPALAGGFLEQAQASKKKCVGTPCTQENPCSALYNCIDNCCIPWEKGEKQKAIGEKQ